MKLDDVLLTEHIARLDSIRFDHRLSLKEVVYPNVFIGIDFGASDCKKK